MITFRILVLYFFCDKAVIDVDLYKDKEDINSMYFVSLTRK